jgi:prefoldin subunit 5
MNFDTTVKELQKEKADLESKLKQVNTALAALTKLGGKQIAAVPGQTNANSTNVAPTQQVPMSNPVVPPAQPSTKPFGS